METQVSRIEPDSGRFPLAVIWIAGIALTLFCAVGIGAVMGWIPSSMGFSSDKTAVGQLPASTAPGAAAKAQVAAALHSAPVAHPAPVRVATVATCADCGVIESVHEADAKGKGNGLGAAGGAVGGAVAGNEVEKRVKTTKSYEFTVRLNDGSSRVISEAGVPTWHMGDKVKIINGAIQSNA